MTIIPQSFEEIDSCQYLFLRDITEPRDNSLLLLIEEASASPESVTREVAGAKLTDLHSIESTDENRLFEVLWNSYIAYSVRNESFVTADDSEIVLLGRLVRVYSKSNYLDYVSRVTFAVGTNPDPLLHVGINCQNHIIDVVSGDLPRVRRLRPAQS
jgi:hypothetical protein